MEKIFFLFTDSSDYGVGNVLMQHGEDGGLYPISFGSKVLPKVLRKKDNTNNIITIKNGPASAYEKEAFAVMAALKHNAHILEYANKTIHIYTDHQPLTGKILNNEKVLLYYYDTFSRYKIKWHYVQGTKNELADSLSRSLFVPGRKEATLLSDLEASVQLQQIQHLLENINLSNFKSLRLINGNAFLANHINYNLKKMGSNITLSIPNLSNFIKNKNKIKKDNNTSLNIWYIKVERLKDTLNKLKRLNDTSLMFVISINELNTIKLLDLNVTSVITIPNTSFIWVILNLENVMSNEAKQIKLVYASRVMRGGLRNFRLKKLSIEDKTELALLILRAHVLLNHRKSPNTIFNVIKRFILLNKHTKASYILFIKNVIDKKCQMCIKNIDNKRSFKYGYYNSILTRFGKPGIALGIDVHQMSEVKWDGNTYKYILTCIDLFSRYVIFKRLKSRSSEEIAQALYEVNNEEGRYSIVFSDNEFKNKVIRKLCDTFNINQIFNVPHTPHSRGVIENVHRMVNRWYKSSSTIENSWPALISQVGYVYNITLHSSLGITPWMLQKGRDPTELLEPLLTDEQLEDLKEEDVQNFIVKKRISQKILYEVVKKKQSEIIKNYINKLNKDRIEINNNLINKRVLVHNGALAKSKNDKLKDTYCTGTLLSLDSKIATVKLDEGPLLGKRVKVHITSILPMDNVIISEVIESLDSSSALLVNDNEDTDDTKDLWDILDNQMVGYIDTSITGSLTEDQFYVLIGRVIRVEDDYVFIKRFGVTNTNTYKQQFILGNKFILGRNNSYKVNGRAKEIIDKIHIDYIVEEHLFHQDLTLTISIIRRLEFKGLKPYRLKNSDLFNYETNTDNSNYIDKEYCKLEKQMNNVNKANVQLMKKVSDLEKDYNSLQKKNST